MFYHQFLVFTAVFAGIGLLLGGVIVLLISRHRIALNASLMPLRAWQKRTLLHPVPLPAVGDRHDAGGDATRAGA